MNREAVADLVAYVSQLVPAQQFDQYTALAWYDVLGDIPANFEQAREAAAKVAKEQQWIYPSAIRSKLMSIMPPRQHSAPAPAIEAPSKFEPNAARSERIARGAARVRQALAEATPFRDRQATAEVPENVRKAREVAADLKARARRSDPQTLGRAGGRLLSQINQNRRKASQ
jgi:hypothetical protein